MMEENFKKLKLKFIRFELLSIEIVKSMWIGGKT